jgi:hypothetical protein
VLLIVIALAIWCFFLWRAFNAFSPGSDTVPITYNSDSAIPVLMANDQRPITVFNLYYYGADRWGGWPFLLAQFVRRTTGFRWSDQSLFVLQTVWVFIGALLIAALSRRDRFAVAIIYLLTLCLHSQTRYLLFVLSQVYAWQVTALLFGWYSLRRLFETYLDFSRKGVPVWNPARWALATLWFSYLAIWSSPASVPFLFCLAALEAWRVHTKTERERDGRKPIRGYLLGAALILLATVVELLQKINYRRYGMKHFGKDYNTHFALDTGYFTANLKIHVSNLSGFSWWPLYLLPALFLLALAGSYVYFSLRKRVDLRANIQALLSRDTTILIIETYMIAVINFVLVVIVSHVRLALYDDRFMILTHLFAPVSGMLVLFLLFDLTAQYFHLDAYARPALLAAGVIFLALKFPAGIPSPFYKMLEESAHTLSERAPGAVLMGSYWETYVFTSLQRVNAMTPVPFEGQEYRTPWTPEQLKQAREVVVEYSQSKLAGPEGPPAQLSQYGRSLRLIEPKWYANGGYSFALYLNESR